MENKKDKSQEYKNIYEVVPFIELHKNIEKILSGHEKAHLFKLAVFCFSRLYGLSFTNALTPLATEPNNNYGSRRFCKIIKDEFSFNRLKETVYDTLPEDEKDKIREVHDSFREKIKKFKDSQANPNFIKIKPLSLNGHPHPSFQRERGRLEK